MNVIILSLLAAFFSALTTIIAKISLTNTKVDPTLETTIRFFFVFVTLIIVALFTNKFSFTNIKDNLINFNWFPLIISGIAFGISSIFYFFALSKTNNVSLVVSIDRLSLAMAAIMSFIFLGENITISKIIGIIFMILGVIFIFLNK